MRFTKMNGLGNDYVYFDVREINNLHLTTEEIKKICNRHFGIGADGVVIIQNSNQADCFMRIYNSDGTEAEICGNALRCVARILYDAGCDSIIRIETLAGVKNTEINRDTTVSVNMGKPVFCGKIYKSVDFPLDGYSVSVGNPHFVIFSDNISEDFDKYAQSISENRDFFLERTNVEFVKLVDSSILEVRVFERGSGETLACGTGATASFYVANMLKFVGDNATVRLKGGCLAFNINQQQEIVMRGDASYNFLGEINLNGTN